MAMTKPVLQQIDGRQWRMSFVMPGGLKPGNLAHCARYLCRAGTATGKKVAVLQYSGSLSEGIIGRNSQKLLDWLNQRSLKPISSAH
jgi:hypothetical protein